MVFRHVRLVALNQKVVDIRVFASFKALFSRLSALKWDILVRFFLPQLM
jgi:hypothetical protein